MVNAFSDKQRSQNSPEKVMSDTEVLVKKNSIGGDSSKTGQKSKTSIIRNRSTEKIKIDNEFDKMFNNYKGTPELEKIKIDMLDSSDEYDFTVDDLN